MATPEKRTRTASGKASAEQPDDDAAAGNNPAAIVQEIRDRDMTRTRVYSITDLKTCRKDRGARRAQRCAHDPRMRPMRNDSSVSKLRARFVTEICDEITH